ncbi:MAG: Integrase catalytic region [Proteobacteria bacterium]|nr:Integrase catalytic region [Pseudomonadota bacterium]
MYSEADRLRAIELYFKYGKKIVAVVRELGYPTERHLRRWIEAWKAGDGTVKSIQRKPRYSAAQKR